MEVKMNGTLLLQKAIAEGGLSSTVDSNDKVRLQAAKLFWRVHNRGVLTKIWSRLTGRQHRLLALNDSRQSRSVNGAQYLGIMTVAMDKIGGSEGRSADFDVYFRPLKGHLRDRWISVAAARLQGVTLPPVELIHVGDVFYVRDGHHRISVARSLGQENIEAQVSSW